MVSVIFHLHGYVCVFASVCLQVCLCVFADIRRLNSKAVFAKRTGMIILGGGLVKHHVANANLMVPSHRHTHTHTHKHMHTHKQTHKNTEQHTYTDTHKNRQTHTHIHL